MPEAHELKLHRAAALEEMARALHEPDRERALERAREQLRQSLRPRVSTDGQAYRGVALGQLYRTGAEIGAMFIGVAALAGTAPGPES
jgi:hypothetical protein